MPVELRHEYGISMNKIEEIAVSLMNNNDNASNLWCNIPVFKTMNMQHKSLNDIREAIADDVIYIADNAMHGIDYFQFHSPVLSPHQPTGAIALLRRLFPSKLYDLSTRDMVIEMPTKARPDLTPAEQCFEDSLCFHPDILSTVTEYQGNKYPQDKSESFGTMSLAEVVENLTSYHENSYPLEELEEINWRVNYLVECDGKTPCHNHRFLLKGNTVVLNLNHSDVRDLVLLAEVSPHLAGHLGIALALEGDTCVLNHLSNEMRENLIILDALTKCVTETVESSHSEYKMSDEEMESLWEEFLRNCEDVDY